GQIIGQRRFFTPYSLSAPRAVLPVRGDYHPLFAQWMPSFFPNHKPQSKRILPRATEPQSHRATETRRQGDKETRRQEDKETRRQGDKETKIFCHLVLSLFTFY